MQFISESGGKGESILLRQGVLIPVFYIFVAGIFEMIFIYGFLRRIFDKSFGIIPGIILTSVFYSFHHAGFQPEFGKLIFVGISSLNISSSLLYQFPDIFRLMIFFCGLPLDIPKKIYSFYILGPII